MHNKNQLVTVNSFIHYTLNFISPKNGLSFRNRWQSGSPALKTNLVIQIKIVNQRNLKKNIKSKLDIMLWCNINLEYSSNFIYFFFGGGVLDIISE